jgi:hypothetical protein
MSEYTISSIISRVYGEFKSIIDKEKNTPIDSSNSLYPYSVTTTTTTTYYTKSKKRDPARRHNKNYLS